jgi:hypothetical protein
MPHFKNKSPICLFGSSKKAQVFHHERARRTILTESVLQNNVDQKLQAALTSNIGVTQSGGSSQAFSHSLA